VSSHRYGSHCYEKLCCNHVKKIQRNKREPRWTCTRIKTILVSCKLKAPPKVETNVEQLSRMFKKKKKKKKKKQILRDPGAVTPWFHESGANSGWYDFVYMRLVGNSDWHEVLTWDQPFLKKSSLSLIKYACSKQKSQTGLNSIHFYMVPQSHFRSL